MSAKLTFTWEQARQIIDTVVLAHFGEPLKDIHLNLLQDVWEGLTYNQIAQQRYLSVNYLRGDVGPKLWQKLSLAFGKSVTKSNFKTIIEEFSQKQENNESASSHSIVNHFSLTDFPFPEGSVPPDSPLYQERHYESFCHQLINQPGALLQLRSPPLMGKTSLLKKILYQAKIQFYQTLYLDLFSLESHILNNGDQFLQWLCLILGRELNLENALNRYWNSNILGSNDCCTQYLENYILPSLHQPLVLAIDDLDRLFVSIEITQNFLSLLRSWHERAKSQTCWQKIRFIIAYSTSTANFFSIDSSLFNLGALVELEDFQKIQIQNLILNHQLQLSDEQINSLIKSFGGHPYLIRLALYKLRTTSISLESFLENSSNYTGDYIHFLYQQALSLQQFPELIQVFKRILTAEESIFINYKFVSQLKDLGLIKKQGNKVIIKCRLYQDFYATYNL
ncbi:MAG: AAA-like domain-containing protein [Snowella sp.]|nr:AAA-like domain-containing protein [Snowella sp.]